MINIMLVLRVKNMFQIGGAKMAKDIKHRYFIVQLKNMDGTISNIKSYLMAFLKMKQRKLRSR
jgi:hypothetical protein